MAVWSGVEIKGVEQTRRMTALRVALSSRTGGWWSAEPSLASSLASSLPYRPQWPGTHRTSRSLLLLLEYSIILKARGQECIQSSGNLILGSGRECRALSTNRGFMKASKYEQSRWLALVIRNIGSHFARCSFSQIPRQDLYK